jgi:hypothetical protein
MLRELSARGALDDAEITALQPGLLVRTKGPALDILKILDAVRVRRPDLNPMIRDVAVVALNHPDADVQLAAVDVLTAVGARRVAEDYAAGLAPRVRVTLGVWPSSEVDEQVAFAAPAAKSSPVLVSRSDLVERTAAQLENASDPMELELVLAGLARLDDPSSLHPLTKRARAILERGPREGVSVGWLRGHLARLVLLADGESLPALPTPSVRTQFLARRMELVAAILGGHARTSVLLATPTTTDGWIDPALLVAQLQSDDIAPNAVDLVGALLRLAPDGRPEALRTLERDDEIGEVLRHALGGPPAPRSRWRRGGARLPTSALWIAASRTRDPLAEDPRLLDAGFTGAGQGRPVKTTVSTIARPYSWRDTRGEHQGTHWDFAVRVAEGSAAEDPSQPTAVARHDTRIRGGFLEDWTGWLLSINPNDAEPVLTEVCWPVLDAISGSEVQHDASRVLAALSDHPGHLGTLAAVTLAAGLAADRVDQRVLAVDAVLVHAAARRLSVEAMAAGMAVLAPACQPGRWAGSLAQLADAEGGAFVGSVLSQLLPTLDRETRGIHSLIELLVDDRIKQGFPAIDPTLRSWLLAYSGNGRAQRAARQILTP